MPITMYGLLFLIINGLFGELSAQAGNMGCAEDTHNIFIGVGEIGKDLEII